MMEEARSEFTIKPWEASLALLVLGIFCYFSLQWGLEGIIHSRKTRTVPDLHGRSVTAALDLMAPLNLGVRKSGMEFDSSVPISSVIRQDPPAGTTVREGKIVKIVVSQGGETVLAPSILGLPLRNAEMMLRQSQLLLGEVSESYSLKLEKGMVINQEPKAESSVERSALVNVVVSGGPPPAGILLMPDFLRKNVSDVQAWASESGVHVAISKDKTALFSYGTVLTQEPAPDTVLKNNAKISVVISGRLGKGETAQDAAKNFRYELAQGGSESLVRIVIVDKYGERELFNGLRKPGSKIDLPLQQAGSARAKIFVNGILVEERDLQ
jgi:eukaryotic-like serine/threonine-protein kinase